MSHVEERETKMIQVRETEVIEDHLTHLESIIFSKIRNLKLQTEVEILSMVIWIMVIWVVVGSG
jgi:hypothetical protein